MNPKQLTIRRIQSYLPDAVMMHAEHVLDQPLHSIVTDSRRVVKDDFFIAISGERFDAHDFLAQVQESGAIGSLVSNVSKVPAQLPVVVVNNTITALGEIAKAWRLDLAPKVVVVTGSNGKTTVKEMIASIFRAAVGQNHTLSTLGNLNNEIGLPMSLLRMNGEHQLAVIELGMNHPGETKVLADIAAPDITLVNNAQREHQEFMQTVEAVAAEHALAIKALPLDGYAVFPSDSDYVQTWYDAAQNRPIRTFTLVDSTSANTTQVTRPADVIGAWNEYGELEISTPEWPTKAIVKLRTLGDHNAKNALAATAVGIAAQLSKEAIIAGLEAFEAVSGRMRKLDIKVQHTAITLVDDTYNANPDSVIAAIQAIEELPGQRWLVLGDMGEVGDQGPNFHQEVGAYAAHHHIDQLLSIGELTQFTHTAFQQASVTNTNNLSVASQHFDSMEQLMDQLMTMLAKFSSNHSQIEATPLVILVKGSRFTKMERVIQHLLSKEDPCYSS